MKKIISISLCFLMTITLFGCQKKEAPIKWFDFLSDSSADIDDVKDFKIEEFQNVTFRWNYESMEAVKDGEAITLFTGMPIWSVYAYDLTGDGKPEICSTISFGSGLIDTRIVAYDYANSKTYELADRGNFDYSLGTENNKLIVEKRECMGEEIIETGELIFKDNSIQMKNN